MIKCKNLRNGFFKTLKFKTESDYISLLTLSPDGRYLAFYDSDLKITIMIWQAKKQLFPGLHIQV